ncbi:hypothetical protein [Serratia sp. (in: enterobacteria)]|uniref:hypothetical protein n=1 Tax=Serratia sp. (in: enterobacteria) TaxID=616 RepID=UPI0039897C6B
MSYNQKVWLGVLTICTLFWLALISGLYTYGKSQDHQHDHGQQEQAMSTQPAKHHSTLAPAL